MAGFFGLFNYEKEGPGIDKNAPKKKTLIVFFETFFRNFWKFVPINAFFCLLSLPIITGGISSVGLTHVTRNIARDKHSFGLSDFLETIRKNWKQALAEGIINTIALALMFFTLSVYWSNAGQSHLATIGLGITMGVLIIFLLMRFYMFTLTITFKFNLRQIYRNSFRFVFLNFWKSLLCGIILLAVYIVNYLLFLLMARTGVILIAAIQLMLYICCFPAFRFLLIQYCTFPAIRKFIIDPYYEQHPDEDIEMRRNLGVYDEPEDDEDEEDADADETLSDPE